MGNAIACNHLDVYNFHALVIVDDSTLIKSDASLSCEGSAACPANVILFCLFTQ